MALALLCAIVFPCRTNSACAEVMVSEFPRADKPAVSEPGVSKAAVVWKSAKSEDPIQNTAAEYLRELKEGSTRAMAAKDWR